MSDHEFEKQVRQKLNNLKLAPTSEAWENIEEKLRERKRRVPLLWLPLLLAGLAAGGYVIVNSGKKGGNTALAVAQKAPSQTPRRAISPAPTGDPAPRPTGAGNGHINDSINFLETPNLAGLKTINGQTLLSEKNHIGRSVITYRKAAGQPAVIERPTEKPATPDEFETQLTEENISTPAERLNQDLKRTLSISKLPPSKEPTPAVPKTAIQKAPQSKWSYAVHAYSGVSAEHEGGLFGFRKPKVEDVAYTNSFAGTVVNYAPVYKPSSISPGLTFSAGAELKRELSKRLSISAGLNYTQMNTHLKVGDKVNSGNVVNNGIRGYLYVQSYYQLDQNDNREYRNKYHFIELPITLHTRINNSSSLPIYWDAGFIVSRLLSSTSLHFDGTTGVYYKNDRLLNQTQAGVMTGLSFALFNKTAHPLWIGPSARSSISSVLKKDISASKHFVTLGLDVKLFLKK